MSIAEEPANLGTGAPHPFAHIHPGFRGVMSCPDQQRLTFLD